MDKRTVAKRIGKRLQELRHKKNMSQEQIANILGTCQRNISYWETGRFVVPPEMLFRICTEFNVAFEFFDVREKVCV